MTKTVLGVSCLLIIAVSSILFNNWSSSAYDAKDDPNLIPWNENRLLQFSDFQGVAGTFRDDYTGERGDFAAFTWTTTYYNWWPQITQNQPCMYTITAFDDNAYFYKNLSWFKNEYASDMYILNHEQKHFDITEIQVRKTNEIVSAEFLGKQFACPSSSGLSQNDAINKKISQDLQPLLDQITQEMNQMGDDYDAQTNHGADPQMQKEWDDYIANLLDYYEPFKDKQEIQFIQEETEEQSTLTCPPDYPYLHSDGYCYDQPESDSGTCPADYPYLWSDGYCYDQPESDSGTCPADYPYLWSDGSCYDQPESNQSDELNQKGNDLFDLERYDEAISYYDRVLEIDPNDIVALTNKGLALRNLERYDEAISYYDRVLEIDPNDSLVLNNKGAALYQLDQNQEALDYYDMALEIDPNYVSALYNKGHLLNDLQKYRDAIPYLDRALTIDPEDFEVLDEKGYALASLGSHEEALEYYDRALAIAPDDISTLFDKGFSLVELGRYDEAISYYDLVLEQDPKDVITLNNKGYALLQLGKNDEALVYFNKALDIDPNYELAQENKDIALEELAGKPEEGGCLIATATFGSELAPQVQFLRELRDNAVLSTASGTSFMTAFNAFYYSFSPTVADLERQNPIFKEAVKTTITPLLSSLSLLQYVDIDSDAEMLGYGISIILLNVGMYFVAPSVIILKLRSILRTKRDQNQDRMVP